ncbi:tRNA (adenine(22)-N(1))-methyltransferase [Salsuginibacillus kocurii]|uniref:tRNA (adenine(22)-N(1))-methyltransferase n=1 Tax=Salsuginibacillus kocurii TaxID=427078 RepID=UPI00035D77EF|nr:tRNA (adenine(22)-N(1))-methyltransferase TrmK [Salsuginibacillus kocurii]
MYVENLSPRLQAIAKHIPSGAFIADIGSDHAHLPLALWRSEIISRAIAGEYKQGPYASAIQNVQRFEGEQQISVRKGNGLEVLSSTEEVDAVIIAGMGGELIRTILSEGNSSLQDVKRLVLQPNVSADSVRSWLIENGWELQTEEIIQDAPYFYEILVASPGQPDRPYQSINKEAALLLGPYLMKEKNAAFKAKWEREYKNWQRVLGEMEHAAEKTTQLQEKRARLLEKMKIVKEVL